MKAIGYRIKELNSDDVEYSTINGTQQQTDDLKRQFSNIIGDFYKDINQEKVIKLSRDTAKILWYYPHKLFNNKLIKLVQNIEVDTSCCTYSPLQCS